MFLGAVPYLKLIREVVLRNPALPALQLLSTAGCSAGELAGGIEIVELKAICGFNDSHAEQTTNIFAFQFGRLPQRVL
jgi:hypothetical protein